MFPPIWVTTLCTVCGHNFTADEWDARHDGADGTDIHEDCCGCVLTIHPLDRED